MKPIIAFCQALPQTKGRVRVRAAFLQISRHVFSRTSGICLVATLHSFVISPYTTSISILCTADTLQMLLGVYRGFHSESVSPLESCFYLQALLYSRECGSLANQENC